MLLQLSFMQLSETSTNDAINQLFDDVSFSSILNHCGWSLTEPLTQRNKLQFLHHLVHEEVIMKRDRNLKAFCCGLDSLHMLDVIKVHPDTTMCLFVHEHKPITSDLFMSLVSSIRLAEIQELRAFNFFKYFVTHLGHFVYYFDILITLTILPKGKSNSPDLPFLLRFVTGLSTIPPLGLQCPIEILYQSDVKNLFFPKTQACFSILMLPVTHTTKEEFFSAFMKTLEMCGDYGNA